MMEDYTDMLGLERPKQRRPRMDRADRAKIFMPFAALKGYEESLEEVLKRAREEVAGEIETEEIEDIQGGLYVTKCILSYFVYCNLMVLAL